MLSSAHTGGDIILQLKNVERSLRIAVKSELGYSYLGWYADVKHWVKPVESGYRLVLTYNLINTASSSSRQASILDDHKLNFGRVLGS